MRKHLLISFIALSMFCGAAGAQSTLSANAKSSTSAIHPVPENGPCGKPNVPLCYCKPSVPCH